MKSEKAKVLIGNKSNRADEYYGQVKVIRNDYAEKAIEIAEQEVIEMAIELHRSLCCFVIRENLGTDKQSCKSVLWGNVCRDDCMYMKIFIEKLNNK